MGVAAATPICPCLPRSHPVVNQVAPKSGRVHRLLTRLARAPIGGVAALIPSAPPVAVATIVRRFWPFVRPHVRWMLVGLIPVALLPVVETVEIWLFQVVVDDVLAPRDLSGLPALALAFLALTLATGSRSEEHTSELQ